MPNFDIRVAHRSSARARVGLMGPSGSGKTYGALLFARGLVGEHGKICLIDTEARSAELYSELTPFNVLVLSPPFSPARYIAALAEIAAQGFDVAIIDSLSHAWMGVGGVLDIVDVASRQKAGGKFAGWAVGGDAHQKLIDTILQSPLHIIATMRSKTEWSLDRDASGRVKPTKVGLAPVQRDAIEYEFTAMLDIEAANHQACAVKDRTGLFVDRQFQLSIAEGEKFATWLAGENAAPAAAPVEPEQKPADVPVEPEQKPEAEPTGGELKPPSSPGELKPPTSLKAAGAMFLEMGGGDTAKAKVLCQEVLGCDSLRGQDIAKIAGSVVVAYGKWLESSI